jgi:hypothetical protein
MLRIGRVVLTLGLAAMLVAAVIAASFGAEIRIAMPLRGSQISGAVEVVATMMLADGEEVTQPHIQTADGGQIALVYNEDGTYTAEVDTTMLRNGCQSLLVFVTPHGADERREGYDDAAWAGDKYVSATEVPVVVRNPYHFYWGDLHAHTSYSDGAWLPREAYAYARDEAKLDFFAITDHSEILTCDEYADTIAQAMASDDPGRFVALWGAERTDETTGHINFYMSPTHVLPADLNGFYVSLGEMWLLGHFNHPTVEPTKNGERHNDFQQFRYSPEADRSMAMVEVRNASEEECYIALLDSGWHVGAAGCEDEHSRRWGQGPTWTVALARHLTREGILEALWARRVYSTADRDLQLDFTLDGEDMGAQVSRPAGSLTCRVAVKDQGGDAVQQIDLFVDGKTVVSERPGAAEHVWTPAIDLTPGRHYCFVRVQQGEDRMTWSSPIWVSAYPSP